MKAEKGNFRLHLSVFILAFSHAPGIRVFLNRLE
jgi:hypothetical protein